MKMYCPFCNDEQETNIIQKWETYPVKGIDTTIYANVRSCCNCNGEIWDPDLDDENLMKAYEKYREQEGLLTPAEIKRIRSKYKMSQVAFAKVLGLGEKTITRYENGSLQDEALNNLILLVDEPTNFQKLLGKNHNKLTTEEKECLETNPFAIPVYRWKTPVSPYRYSQMCWDRTQENIDRIA